MKKCLYTEFNFFSMETGFDSAAIGAFYGNLPIADLLEDNFAETCVNSALMITESNIMGAIKLIIKGEFDFSNLLGESFSNRREEICANKKKYCR